MAYSLILTFDRQGEDFVLGFEAGRLWERVKAEPGEFDETVHAANAEMVLRIAEAQGRSVFSEELGNGWLRVCFGAAP